MPYLAHPSQLFNEVCAHCLNFCPCLRVAVTEAPKVNWTNRDFDPSIDTIRVNEIIICQNCRSLMEGESTENCHQWYGRSDPRGLSVGNILDAESLDF